MQSLHVPKIETPNYLILIWLFYPFKYIVRFLLVFCRFDSAHHYSGISNIQDEIAEQTLRFNSGTLKRYCMNCLKMTAFNTSPPFFKHSIRQTNIILNIRIVFNIWVKNHLQSVTLCSVEPMNITKCPVFTPKMLCQVCSCLQYVGLCAFSFVFNTCEMCSVGLRSGEWLGHWNISHFFDLRNAWVALSNQFCAVWLNQSRE